LLAWAALVPAEPFCLVPDLSAVPQNKPFVYQAAMLETSGADEAEHRSIAGAFPWRHVIGVQVFRDFNGLPRYTPVSGVAILLPYSLRDGSQRWEWVVTTDGMLVQPPEAIFPDAPSVTQHSTHEMRLLLRLPVEWAGRYGEPGDYATRVGLGWQWNTDAPRQDEIGSGLDLSPRWADLWRVPCDRLLGPGMLDLALIW